MQDDTKACILSAYAPNTSHGVNIQGTPYKRGQERLYRSLLHHGFRYDILLFDDWPNDQYDKNCGYNIKAAAFEDALRRGYERILWVDSSVWAIKPVEPLFDYIDHNGWYFYSNGFNMAQTANDDALDYFGIDRDQAEKIPDISSSMFGVHMGNPKSAQFIGKWLRTAQLGMWATSREHANGSEDPRFMCDRQDQSCASIILNQVDMHMTQRNEYSAIAGDNGSYPDSVILVMRGL